MNNPQSNVSIRWFENPENGHRESVSSSTTLAAFFFGIFFWIYKGIWPHAAVLFVTLVIGAQLRFFGVLIITIPWLIYTIQAKPILAAYYLRQGWKEVQA